MSISIASDFLKYYYSIVLINFKNNKPFKHSKNHSHGVKKNNKDNMHFLLYSYALTGIFIISRCSEGDVFKLKKTVFVF